MQGPYLGRRVWIEDEGERHLVPLLVDGGGGGGEAREAAADLDVLERDQQDPRLATVDLHAVKLRMASAEHLAQHLMRGGIDGDFVISGNQRSSVAITPDAWRDRRRFRH